MSSEIWKLKLKMTDTVFIISFIFPLKKILKMDSVCSLVIKKNKKKLKPTSNDLSP